MPLSPNEIAITDSDLQAYRDQGYWISPVLFDEEEIETIRHEVVRICNGERDFDTMHWQGTPNYAADSPDMRQVCNGWWVNDIMQQMVKTPVIGHIGATFMATETVRIWHDQMLHKPGLGPDGDKALVNNIGWHQDYAHWQCANTDHFCTAWVALQDTDRRNGCMQFIKGSHTWGLFEDAYSFGHKDLDALEKKYRRDDRAWAEEPCILKAGQASFHHPLLFHGSGPNPSREPRLSFVVHMMAGDCGYKKNGRFHPNAVLLGPFVKDGDLFEGPLFPQIWPTEAVPQRA